MEYFIWLCEIIDNGTTSEYTNMLYLLHNIEFKYYVPMDENRLGDAMCLREYYYNTTDTDERCSVFEMFVALSKKCEEFIMDNGEENRICKWFWTMMINLGLDMYDNSNYDEQSIRDIIDVFLDREYMPNGYGGAFTTMDTRCDMRETELWLQLNKYINENNII